MKMNPRPVQNLCSSTIHKLACGSMHSLALIGDPQQVSNLSSQYYAGANSFDVMQNYWVCDFGGAIKKTAAERMILPGAAAEDDI